MLITQDSINRTEPDAQGGLRLQPGVHPAQVPRAMHTADGGWRGPADYWIITRALQSLVHVGLVTVFTGSCCQSMLLAWAEWLL